MNAAFDVDHAAILHKTLAAVVPELYRHCRDSWVLIGSAAARLAGADGWEPVRVGRTMTVEVAGLHVPIPVVAEQVRLLESFGRPKDLQRIALLKSLSEEWV
ncbi:hypothetical protein [Rhodanobacter sp. B04]|uniref:hypothetical protein n=1 Tax=Rhodanobacter sp. B04 TaxID=1945860 RepID=UPI00098699EF|nr:hypothetical protein [Rhodanobacter sp. B04]